MHRVDDRRIINGIIFVIRNGLRWRDAPAAYGPHKTIYNRFIRWSRMGCSTRSMIDALPRARTLLADRGYDADWFRAALAERGIAACIPSKISRKTPIPHDVSLYRQRHRIENMFAKLKDWRRIHAG